MSTTSNSWTVATKKGKVASSPKGKKPKSFSETMPRIATKAPVEESQTIYNVFRQEEERKEQKLIRDPVLPVNTTASSNSVGSKKNPPLAKKVPDKKKVPSLEEALAEINISELQSVLAKDKVTFPDNPDVWLKDLVSYFNLKLDKLPCTDPTYPNKQTDYPAKLLPKSMKSFLLSALTQSSILTLKQFLDHCIETIMSDISKGMPSYGYHIFVQLLLHARPEMCLSGLPAYLALLKDNINRPQRALCILWTIGQAGLSNLGNGLKVWLELMLPVLNIRNLSMYAVQYLESLFRLHPTLKLGSNDAVFTKREFFKLFDELFSTQPSLSNELRTRMLQMFPKLKVIAFGSQPEKNLHLFFSSFLSRCSADCPNQKKTELLGCLVMCLCVDKQSFSTWRQIYVKHLSQSSILLQHLVSEFDSIRLKMDASLLRETVRAFSVTHDDLTVNKSTNSQSDIDRCINSCNELLTRLTNSRVQSHWFLTLVVIVIAGALSCDVYKNGSVTNCWTYRTLLAAGVIDAVQQAWTRLCLYSNKAWSWLAMNTPSYLSVAAEWLRPYLQFCYEKLLFVTSYLAVTLQPHWQFMSDQVMQFISWVNNKQPLVINVLSQYVDWFLQNLVYVTVWLQSQLQSCIAWIVSNVLTGSWSPENILRITSDLATSLQSAVSTGWHYAVDLIK